MAWESLHTVDGDSCFCDTEFHLSHSPGREVPVSPPQGQQQLDQVRLAAAQFSGYSKWAGKGGYWGSRTPQFPPQLPWSPEAEGENPGVQGPRRGQSCRARAGYWGSQDSWVLSQGSPGVLPWVWAGHAAQWLVLTAAAAPRTTSWPCRYSSSRAHPRSATWSWPSSCSRKNISSLHRSPLRPHRGR